MGDVLCPYAGGVRGGGTDCIEDGAPFRNASAGSGSLNHQLHGRLALTRDAMMLASSTTSNTAGLHKV